MKRFLTIRVFSVNMHPSQRPGNTKRREGDATSMIQPLQSQDLRPQTVIIRKGLLGGVQVMLYAGQHYHLAKNNQDLLARAQALVKDVGKGDYPCPLELSVHAVF